MNWPPPFTIQRSSRIRSVRLQICQRRGLRLILPQTFTLEKIPSILHQNRDWIERQFTRIQPLLTPLNSAIFPTQLSLLAINEHWQISYETDHSNLVFIQTRDTKKLVIYGNKKNSTEIKNVLHKWIKKRAKLYLIPWLKKLSSETELNYLHATIRNTRTRWGSCSKEKKISLSCKLLFLPPILVEHVLLHELCHTIHLNHSKNFWDLFTQVNAHCRELRKQLRQAQKYIPLWLEK